MNPFTQKMTTAEFSKLLGLNGPRLSELKAKGIVAPESPNQWDFEEVGKYCEHLREIARSAAAKIRNAQRGDDVNPDGNEDPHLAEYRKQKARMARYDADLRAGYLVSTTVVRKYLIKMITVARMRLQSIPNRVADVSRPFLKDTKGQDAIRDAVTNTVEEVLHELAESAATTGLYDRSGDAGGTGRKNRKQRPIVVEAAGETISF